MSAPAPRAPLLTLEPLIEAVRDGIERAGWALSGLQKTTSHEYEGRWAGQTSRSAYLFFHRPGGPEGVSVDVFLDETSTGLHGNLALVVEGPSLRGLGDPEAALDAVAGAARDSLAAGYHAPVSLRLRLDDATRAAAEAEIEYRIKLRLPARALRSGASAVSALATTTVGAFERILEHPGLRRHAVLE